MSLRFKFKAQESLSILFAFWFISYDFTSSQSLSPSKVITILIVTSVLYRFRYHLNLICLKAVFRDIVRDKLLPLVAFIYFFLQMLRPILFSIDQRPIGAIFWPLQLLAITLILVVSYHNHKMHKELEVANKTQSSDDKTLNLVVISMFLYLFIVALFAMTNLELTVGTLEFNALGSTFLPFYILFPLIWIALTRHSLMYYSIAASTLMFMSFLVVKSNSRAGFVSLFICISLGLLYFYTADLKRSSKLLRILPLLFGGFVFLVIKWQTVKQMFLDIAMTGKTRILDGSNVAEIVDLDRKLHMKSALDAVMTDIFHFIFGYGYRESSFVLSSPLFRYYKEYMPHLDFVDELGSYTNVSTFGMSGFLTDFGFAGLFFLVLILAVQVKSLPWHSSFSWSVLRLGCLIMLLAQLYANNFLDSPFFIGVIILGHLMDRCYILFMNSLKIKPLL